MPQLQNQLFAMQDLSYRNFQCRLMPTVDPKTVIGIRTPNLRTFATQFAKEKEAAAFLSALPHVYYEENNLHAFLIAQIKDFDTALAETERFLPYIDNWATCDGLRPKIFAKHKKELLLHILRWLDSEDTYTIRFAVNMLMVHFLGEDFSIEQMQKVCSISSDEYYVKMVIAWYMAEALYRQYDAAFAVLERRTLDPWAHNKAIQKACESKKIADETKAILKSIKV